MHLEELATPGYQGGEGLGFFIRQGSPGMLSLPRGVNGRKKSPGFGP
jgi:hypothetical protein